jgi:hypothetical protein
MAICVGTGALSVAWFELLKAIQRRSVFETDAHPAAK